MNPFKSPSFEIGEHFYSTEICTCEMCNKELPIDSEIVVTSYGGFNDPSYKFSCIKCVNRANRKAAFYAYPTKRSFC